MQHHISAIDVERAAKRLRASARGTLAPPRIADAIAAALARWRDREFAPRRETVARISANLGFSIALLDESLDALLAPFTSNALAEIASRIATAPELVGFVMAGNVAGAGLHEVAIALIAGAGLLIKTSTREPYFFAEFARTLEQVDPAIAERISVLNWPRDRADLTGTLRHETDLLVGYGDDATIASLADSRKIVGFGSKVSGAVISRSAMNTAEPAQIAARLARDVTLFEQLGCLSPHHIFIECGNDADAAEFAQSLADAMCDLAQRLPPPARLELEDAAALRSVRETARWRSIAGDPIKLIEGPALSWAVIIDPDASFTPSPGLRCVYLSRIGNLAELRARLSPVHGRIEAFIVAADSKDRSVAMELLAESGVSYVAEPGSIQSPPLTWRHGGGEFFDRMTRQR